MELAMAIEMVWVRVASDCAGWYRVGDELSISVIGSELFDKLRKLKDCATP
jgi:hypothetical protein